MLKDNNILSTKIPPNIKHVFQPLDLTVDKFAKDGMKGKFSIWFSREIPLGLENGVELDDIEVDYRISILIPLHAKWLVELYKYMSIDEGKEIVANDWKKVSIFGTIKLCSSSVPSLDPFSDIYLLIESLQLRENLSLLTLFPEELDCFCEKIQEGEDYSDSEWEPDGDSDDCSEPESDDDGNTFDAFNDGL